MISTTGPVGRSQTPGRAGLLADALIRPVLERPRQRSRLGSVQALGIRTREGIGAARGQEPKANTMGPGLRLRTALRSATGQVGPKLKTSFPVLLTGGDAGSAWGRKMESTPGLLTTPSSSCPHSLLSANPGDLSSKGQNIQLENPRAASASAQAGEEGCAHPPLLTGWRPGRHSTARPPPPAAGCLDTSRREEPLGST